MKEKGKNWKIIAVGNPLKEDDAIALKLADELKEFNIIKAETVPENFICQGDKIVLIDSAYFKAKPGAIKLFEKDEIAEQHITSHNLTTLMLTLAKEAKLIGIQPNSTQFKEDLSLEMEKMLPEIKEKVSAVLKKILLED